MKSRTGLLVSRCSGKALLTVDFRPQFCIYCILELSYLTSIVHPATVINNARPAFAPPHTTFELYYTFWYHVHLRNHGSHGDSNGLEGRPEEPRRAAVWVTCQLDISYYGLLPLTDAGAE